MKLIAIIVCLSHTVFGQTSIIQNNGFEQRRTLVLPVFPNGSGQFNKLKEWKELIPLNTSEWYSLSTYNPKMVSPPPDGSEHFAGFGSCEGGQIKLDRPVFIDKPVFIRYQVCHATQNPVNTELNMFLMENEYMGAPNCDFTSNLTNESIFHTFTVDTRPNSGHLPLEWKCQKSNWKMIQDVELEWLGIKGETRDTSEKGGSNDTSYQYIDQVKLDLLELCEHPCIPDLDDVYVFSTKTVDPGVGNEFILTMHNAIGYEVTIRDRENQNTVFYRKEINLNGLDMGIDPSTPIWQFKWSGDIQNTNNFVAEGAYVLLYKVWNCTSEEIIDIAGTKLILGSAQSYFGTPPTPAAIYSSSPELDLSNCCVPNLLLLNSIQHIVANYSAEEYVVAGEDYKIPSSGDIDITAGIEVKFVKGFKVSRGGYLKASIQTCTAPQILRHSPIFLNEDIDSLINRSRLSITDNQKPNEENYNNNQIIIYPNPNNGNFTITNHSDHIGSFKFQIRNGLGQIVKSDFGENNVPKYLDISTLGKGVYFVTLNSNNMLQVRKIYII